MTALASFNLSTFIYIWSVGVYLDGSDGLLAGHLEGVGVLGTQEELHLDAGTRQWKEKEQV